MTQEQENIETNLILIFVKYSDASMLCIITKVNHISIIDTWYIRYLSARLWPEITIKSAKRWTAIIIE